MQTSSGVLHNSSIYNTGKLERAYMYKNIEMLYMYDICTCYTFHKMKYYIKNISFVLGFFVLDFFPQDYVPSIFMPLTVFKTLIFNGKDLFKNLYSQELMKEKT